MPSTPKIAIATILHPIKEYSYQLALDWMKNQTYENVEFIVRVDTGKYGDHHKLKGFRESIRVQAIELDVSALFFFDCDTIAPLDVIEEFIVTPADLMTGIYFSRIDARRAVCWKHDDHDQQFLNSEIYTEIDGAGMGCCFIRRPVLDACTFEWSVPDDDYVFYDQAKKLGFRLLSLNLMRCRHYSSATGYTYYDFGDTGIQPTEEYVICAPDGITLNGVNYPKGKAIVDRRLMAAIKEIDAPYAEGKIKQRRTVVSVVGKKELGVAPTHTQTHTPGRTQGIPKKGAQPKKEVGIWRQPR